MMNFVSCGRCVRGPFARGPPGQLPGLGVRSTTRPPSFMLEDEESCRNLHLQFQRRRAPLGGYGQVEDYEHDEGLDEKMSCCGRCLWAIASFLAFAVFLAAGYYVILSDPTLAASVSSTFPETSSLPFQVPNSSSLPFEIPALPALPFELPETLSLPFHSPAINNAEAESAPPTSLSAVQRANAANVSGAAWPTSSVGLPPATVHVDNKSAALAGPMARKPHYDCGIPRSLGQISIWRSDATNSSAAAEAGAGAAIALWRVLDKDVDRHISQNELASIKAEKHALSPHVGQLLSVADSNGDHFIDPDEFVAAWTNDPSVASLTKDGISVGGGLASEGAGVTVGPKASGMDSWSEERKLWCCKIANVGCAEMIAEAKKTLSEETHPPHWVAVAARLPTATSDLSTPTVVPVHSSRSLGFPRTANHRPKSPYDCDKDYYSWLESWSYDKKDWCCWHRKRGCAMMRAKA